MTPTYQSGFYAPGRGVPKYPELWKGCVGAWAPCLGPTGLTLRDWSRVRNDGTLTSMDPATDWAIGGGKYALDFDGVNDCVLCGTDGAFRVGAKSLVVSLWVYASSSSFASSPKVIFDTSGFNVTSGGIWIALDNRGGLRATAGVGAQIATASGGSRDVAASNVFTSSASWKHISVFYKNGSARIFVNGVDATTVEAMILSGTGDYVPKNAIVSLGAAVGGGNYFTGQIDDIRQDVIASDLRQLASRRGIAYELAPRKVYSLPATVGTRQYKLLRPSILRGA